MNYLKLICCIFFLCYFLPSVQASKQGDAKWVTAKNIDNSQPNQWMILRKDWSLKEKPKKAITQIAADSKYWLWINGHLAVFEGSLKRGPNPHDSYYDELDIAPFLKKGKNQVALLVWYFGKEGFSHKNSGKAGLIFRSTTNEGQLVSDNTWMAQQYRAYQSCGDPKPNYRLPESNLRFDSRLEINNWQTIEPTIENGYSTAIECGEWGDAPWNHLVKRPIPFWKDFGIIAINNATIHKGELCDTLIAPLPYNMQMTPIIEVDDKIGGRLIEIRTDHTIAGGEKNIRAEYITRNGMQQYESLGWMSGEKILLCIPHNISVKAVRYRQTGYDTQINNTFTSDNAFLNRFWEKALRTLYINMRDTYFDCPDRERAQWWGDAVILSGESFYTCSPSVYALIKKGIHELLGWQRADSTIFSPIPAGNYSSELPGQMLASIGEYGIWNYYRYTGDRQTIEDVYPNIRKYLGVWKFDTTDLTQFRKGGWTWGDWGDNKDIRLILAGWHYLALQGASKMAALLGHDGEAEQYKADMQKLSNAFNQCWNGSAYRHPDYKGQTDDRVQALAVIAGIADEDKYPAIYKLFQKEYHASPYMEKYVIEALFKMGQGKFALQRMEQRFAPMVNNREHSTLFEGWDIGNKAFGGGTTNHAWSGGGVIILASRMFGIEPLEAGYRTFKIEPHPEALAKASIAIPTIVGTIKSSYSDSSEKLEMQITVPAHTQAVVYLPKNNYQIVSVNNKTAKKQNIPMKFQKKGQRSFLLSAGNYNIVATK